MKKLFIASYLSFFFFLTINMLSASALSATTSSSTEEKQYVLPDPLKLEPNWFLYFDTNPTELEKRVKEQKLLLDTFLGQLNNEEDVREVEKELKEFYSHLNSFAMLKNQEVQKGDLIWLPNDQYTLDDYFKLSDQIRNLKLDIKYKNTELKRFKYSENESYHLLTNDYADYLNQNAFSKEKFLRGLEVMVRGARYLYIQEEISLIKRLIKVDQELLRRYQDERDQIEGKLVFDINQQEVDAEIDQIRLALSETHKELMNLESESVNAFTQDNGIEQSRLINQRLTSIFLKEAYYKAKLHILQAKLTLKNTLGESKEVDYENSVGPIKTFKNETRKELVAWNDIVSTEIDLLSQSFVKFNGEITDKETPSEYEDSLKIALSNRALLDAIDYKVFHICLVLDLIDQQIMEKQTVLDNTSYYISHTWENFSESFGGWFYYSLFDIGGVPVNLVGIFKAVLIFLMAIWFSSFARSAIRKFSARKGKSVESTLYTLQRIVHYIILLLGLLFALGSIGITMQNLAIVLGAVGIGVGFGLQNIVNNFLCGLTILFERNVKIGDYVELESGFLGRITEVNVQNTTIHTFDGLDVLVPNSSLIANNVVNWTKKDPYQRLHIPFGVAYGTDQDKVSDVVCEVAKQMSFTMRSNEGVNDPEVWLVNFGDSSLDFELVVWVNIFRYRGRKAMKAEYLGAIEKAFKENGIEIPFPQRDLYLKTIPDNTMKLGESKDEEKNK
ncbi:MAG: mechanosensitive ion channel domain-containing protein [Chlamydiota bacterium]|nr:mechanosensitive ion channel domain-containing protein [Chlamydiota bacterium]